MTKHDVLDRIPQGLLIGGRWEESERHIDVLDPATGRTLREVADGDPEAGTRAIAAAAAAAEEWVATAPRYRSELLRAAFERIEELKEEFALLITLEMGKPLAESRGEVAYGNEFLRWFSEEAVRVTGRYGDAPEGTGKMLISQHPVGPSLLITPWNFPLAMATRKVAPALAAGCTVVLKPSELTPLTTLFFARVLEEVGVPNGVVNVVTTSRAAAVTDAILADSRLRKLSFTGSTGVGVALLGKAAPSVLRTSMELGGNAPFLVFEDADIDRAVDGAIQAKFRNIGQACTAGNRFFVHASRADEFVAALSDRMRAFSVGPGTDPGVSIGPLIDDRARQKASRLISDAVDHGADVLLGGNAIDGPGTFFEPTLLDNVPGESAINSEEIFGPVLSVRRFTDDSEAIALANDTPFGLVAYAYTDSLERASRLIDKIETGMLGINAGVVSNAAAPFGGVKQSGIGREGGAEGIKEYLSTKYSLIR